NPPQFYDQRTQVIDKRHTEAMSDFLRGVVTQGTAIRLNALCQKHNIQLCAKTGTTNDCKDAWIVGYTKNWGTQNVVIGIFIGYPQPESMGKMATGSKIALPFLADLLEQMATLRGQFHW
ncbi:MAG: penicillin-binding transpeptidase domain-containing protein, partial [Alphaproteobacteria bacterium]|nr:penicillin-binding transpeptidase domain-containing protein [Alphaproteobacteria bacterium]